MVEQETLQECPCCKSTGFEDFVESNGYKVVMCRKCQLLFVNPRPSERSIKKMFVEDYIGSDERVTEDFTAWRRISLHREADKIKRWLPHGGRLLDIGTASGAFLGEFADDQEWEVEGVEPSRFAARAAAERYRVQVHAGFLRDLELPNYTFDVVVSLDAFYFHPDPRSDLEEIARLLKPNGLLAIEIPGLRFRLLKNTGWLCKMIYGVPARLNAGVHLFYYSRKTLGQMVQQFGFEEIAAYPEQSPVYGSWAARAGNWFYYQLTAALYKLSAGRLNLAPKEFLVYRKGDK